MDKLRENAKQISTNLAPLVGCRTNDKRWSPRTGYLVCRDLRLAGLISLDTDQDYIKVGRISYQFDNHVTIQAVNLHKLALDCSPIALNPNYVVGVQRIGTNAKDLKEFLFTVSLHKTYSDSSIIDIIEEYKYFKQNKIYHHIMMILLECFTLRYALYEYGFEGGPLNKIQCNSRRIDTLAKNIEYVKYRLSLEEDKASKLLTIHLSTLLLNIKMVKYFISKYYLEA